MPRIEPRAFRHVALVDVQIPPSAHFARRFAVPHREVRKDDLSRRGDAFVYAALPRGAALAPHYPFADVRKGRAPGLVERHVVAAHDGVRIFFFQPSAQFLQAFAVFGSHDVVGVHPHDVLARRFREGEVACRGEIVAPFEIENTVRVFRRRGFGAVGASRVGDDDLVDICAHSVKSPREHFFFVLHYHAKREQSAHSHLRDTAFI